MALDERSYTSSGASNKLLPEVGGSGGNPPGYARAVLTGQEAGPPLDRAVVDDLFLNTVKDVYYAEADL